ncbi:hypothetical protein TTRE_0000303901 [Trichuris trichiura]|uniref:Uncharacterized protein n=1 Tax=Trichuris trichiura TaxID=36087 RepID=A0A077Z4M0_TRITR|nr:hypothetical protein TTRE_0000303901 [Trichuris trichiura]
MFKDAQVILPAKCALKQQDQRTSLTEVERLRGNDANETNFTCFSLASDAGDVANTPQQFIGMKDCLSGVSDTRSTSAEIFHNFSEEMSSGKLYIPTMELNSSDYVKILYYKREVEYTLTVSQSSISSREKTYLKINVNFNFDQIAALATSERDIYLQLSDPPFVSIEAIQRISERNRFVRIPLTEQMVNIRNSISLKITLKKAEGQRFSQRLTSFDDMLKERMVYVAPGKGAFYITNDLPCPFMDSLASDNSDLNGIDITNGEE